jgi:hypothetical protein
MGDCAREMAIVNTARCVGWYVSLLDLDIWLQHYVSPDEQLDVCKSVVQSANWYAVANCWTLDTDCGASTVGVNLRLRTWKTTFAMREVHTDNR